MLSPTDNTNFSVNPILFNLRICRINNPGKIVRKMNPKTCLTKGMSKMMAKSVRRIKPIKIKMHFLIPRLFIKFIFLSLILHKRSNALTNISIQQS